MSLEASVLTASVLGHSWSRSLLAYRNQDFLAHSWPGLLTGNLLLSLAALVSCKLHSTVPPAFTQHGHVCGPYTTTGECMLRCAGVHAAVAVQAREVDACE